MSKWTLLAGVGVLFFLLMQINSGKISTNMVWDFVNDGARDETGFSPVDDFLGEIPELAFLPEPVEVVIEPEPEPDNSLTIAAFGDIMLGRYVRTLMEREGHDYVFENIALVDDPFYGEADLVFGNLEGPIKGEGYRHQTAMRFGFHEDTAEFLKQYGFNILSITNNHSIDQGWDGRESTITALEEQGIAWCGHPTEADAGSVVYREKNGLEYAFVCFNDVIFPLDEEEGLELLREVREEVDLLIVSIHWGAEYGNTASKVLQKNFGREMVEAGADLIIGHHPHVVQDFEIYNDRLILYSLGNFVFDQYWAKHVQEELAVKVELEKEEDRVKTKLWLYPMKSEKSQSRLMNEEERAEWVERFIEYGNYEEELIKEIRGFKLEIGE
jgi:gamma-polyglutamate biosynthesis protein CapA